MPELPPPPAAPAAPSARLGAWLADRWRTASPTARLGVMVGLVGAVVGLAVISLAAGTDRGRPPELDLPRADAPSGAVPAGAEPVFAHAAGALARPGLYRLPAGARVADLIEAAGGPTSDADVHQLNLAARVNDGDRVYVPKVGEPAPVASADAPGAPGGAKLDLNAATQAQLEDLPGVGPATAAAILKERAKRGRFKSVEELLDVRGIGPAKLDQIRELVRV